VVSSPKVGDPLWPNKWCQGHGAEEVGPRLPGPNREVPPTGSLRGPMGEHQRAWPPAGKAHHREPGTATWRCALTMGCERMARVQPVEVLAPCCPHGLHHVPRRDDVGHHVPPPHPRSAREEDQEETTTTE